jgi:riboflavin synthase
MFNGIIKKTGKISKIFKNKKDLTIEVYTKMNFLKNEIGSSICCSGACLTLEKYKKNHATFYLSKETLSKTNFKLIKRGNIINLEKSLKFGDRISGHFVQGHIDTTSSIKKIVLEGKSWVVFFSLSKKFRKYIVSKGSISINGVSLTISKLTKQGFQISVIPQTLKLTNLMTLKENDLVNVEFDILAKYIKNIK